MKKSLFVLLIAMVLIILVSFLLPGEYRFQQQATIQRPLAPVERVMTQPGSWEKWWPGSRLSDSSFNFYGTPVTIKTLMVNGFTATTGGANPVEFQCNWLPGEQNTVSLNLSAVEQTGANPIHKISALLHRFSMQKKLDNWTGSVKSYFENDKSLYGFTIQKTKVKDPALISTKQAFNHFPETAEIYALVDQLQTYIGSRNAKAVNHPILHIHSFSDSSYEAMVAIATDTLLPSSGNFSQKSMVLGFILEGEVTGGAKTAWEAEKMMERYAHDYRKASPAISFQMLVTNRMAEPDTAKWVTKLFYPVFD